jgi:hypothetical protein
MESALRLARELFDALSAEAWPRAADLFEPEHVADWFRDQLRSIPQEQPSITAEQLRRGDPEMPLEVAEYYVARMRRQRSRRTPEGEFAGVDSWAELSKLTPVEAFARFLEARDPRTQFANAVRNLHPEKPPPGEGNRASFQYAVLGAVPEGDDLCHVVYRRRWSRGEEHPGELGLLTCRRSAPGWRMQITDEWMMTWTNFGFAVGAGEEPGPDQIEQRPDAGE